MATFNQGDTVQISSATGYNGPAEILAIRHAVGNYNTGALCMGADVLRGDGHTAFYFLHDIARWNPEKRPNARLIAAAPAMLAALKAFVAAREDMPLELGEEIGAAYLDAVAAIAAAEGERDGSHDSPL